MSNTLRYLLYAFLFQLSLVGVAQQEDNPSQSKSNSSVTTQPRQNAYHMNPYESLGIKAKMLTATDGEYPEFFPNDTIIKIGSILYNTVTKQVIAFPKTDTIYSEATNEPQLTSRFISPDPHAFKYWSLSPYNYVANNPLRNIDPDGRDIIGVNKESAQKARDDIHKMFENKKFDAFRGLISLAKDGKTFNRIDAKALEGALKDSKLSNDDKALVALVTATINSDSKYMVEFAQKGDNISGTGQKIMSEKLPKALVEPVVAANGGLPASIISAFGGGGVTTPTKDGSYSLIIEGLEESSTTDYYNSDAKSYGSNPAGRASTTGHEIFGHGRSSSLGRTTTQHQDAIRTENLILRVMGMGNVQRDGTNHADNTKITDPSSLPDF